MTKKLLFGSFIIFLGIICFCIPLEVYGSSDPMFKNWMAKIDDDVHINNITIPGTHDSASFQGTGGSAGLAKCQDKSLSKQMHRGIRWFDIRLRLIEGKLMAHHGKWYLKQSFNDEIKTAKKFLKDHPTETIIFMISQEYSKKNKDKFFDAVRGYMKDQKLKNFYLEHPSHYPKLGDVRGKIVIFRRFGNSANKPNLGYYLHWDDNTTGKKYKNGGHTFYVQDNYDSPNDDDKFNHFRSTLWRALGYGINIRTGAQEISQERKDKVKHWLFLNYASYALGGWKGIGTPRRDAEVMNPKVDTLVKQYKGKGGGGVILLDYPWDERQNLVKHIIQMN